MVENKGHAALAKSIGYRTSEEMCSAIGVSSQTLTNWKNKKPKTFRAVVAGAEKLKKDELDAISSNRNEH